MQMLFIYLFTIGFSRVILLSDNCRLPLLLVYRINVVHSGDGQKRGGLAAGSDK
jgi:hypothetical protein